MYYRFVIVAALLLLFFFCQHTLELLQVRNYWLKSKATLNLWHLLVVGVVLRCGQYCAYTVYGALYRLMHEGTLELYD